MAYIVATAEMPDEKFESYDEALVVARGITGDYNLDTVQCH